MDMDITDIDSELSAMDDPSTRCLVLLVYQSSAALDVEDMEDVEDMPVIHRHLIIRFHLRLQLRTTILVDLPKYETNTKRNWIRYGNINIDNYNVTLSIQLFKHQF